MRLLSHALAHEVRTQMRSLRFRLLALLYGGGALLPVVLLYARRGALGAGAGPAALAAQLATFQPLLTALIGWLLAVDIIQRERDEGSFVVASLAPASAAGYLLRRLAACDAIVVTLSAVPPMVTAALALSLRPQSWDPAQLLGPWLLRTVPVALAACAFSAGIGTITGGTLSAAIASNLLFALVLGLGNDLLVARRLHLSGPGAWLGIATIEQRADYLVTVLRGWQWAVPATEGAYDWRQAAEASWARGAVTLAMACAVLGASCAYLRRTRRDLPPWRISSASSLRTFLAFANGMRQAVLPDANLAAADMAAMAVAFVLAAASLGAGLERGARYLALARARYAAEERGAPAPTPADVAPVRYRLEGEIRADGTVACRVRADMRNAGAAPASHLAFTLSPRLVAARVAADEGRATSTRVWDRLAIDLDPPIAPGGRRAISMEITGAPAEPRLELERVAFATAYEHLASASIAGAVPDLSLSATLPAITRRRVRLAASDLMPVPRYRPWTLGPARLSDGGRVVDPETMFPSARLDVDLAVPAGWVIADALGDVAAPGRSARLSGSGEQVLADYVVMGGRLSVLQEGGAATLAVLDAHRMAAARQLGAIEAAQELVRQAWTGAEPPPAPVILEDVPQWSDDPYEGMDFWSSRDAVRSAGRILLVPEVMLASAAELPADVLAGEMVASELGHRRPVRPDEQLLFRYLWRALALRRMARGPSSALVPPPPEGAGERVALCKALPFQRRAWSERLPRVLLDCEHRAGAAAMGSGLEDFLADQSGTRGSVRELLDDIGRRGSVSLDSVYEDYFQGEALPVLSLEDVRFHRDGSGWEATGNVRNLGSGRALCPVALQTDGERSEAEVLVQGAEPVPFRLRTAYRPTGVVLDPQGLCYRHQRPPAVAFVAFRGES